MGEIANEFSRKRVLIVDDDPEVEKILREAFEMELPSEIVAVPCASEALAVIERGRFDMILLDLTLPDMSGIDLCRKLRAGGVESPILCLTSRAEVVDRIVGLETGADDYVTKPFSPREVVARVKAIWRRTGSRMSVVQDSEDGSIHFGDLRIDVGARLVFMREKQLELSKTEYDIIFLLASHPGKVFPRDKLLSDVLGYEISEYDQSITSHISRIRMKIEPDAHRQLYIRTVRGVGYRFATAAELLAARSSDLK